MDVDRFIVFASTIKLIYQHIQKIKNYEMKKFDLKGNLVMAIFFLNHNTEGLTASQLSRLCFEDKAGISRIISDLEDKEIVRISNNNPNRNYRSAIILTEKGSIIAKKLDELVDNFLDIGGKDLNDEERNIFYRSLTSIEKNLKKHIRENN